MCREALWSLIHPPRGAQRHAHFVECLNFRVVPPNSRSSCARSCWLFEQGSSSTSHSISRTPRTLVWNSAALLLPWAGCAIQLSSVSGAQGCARQTEWARCPYWVWCRHGCAWHCFDCCRKWHLPCDSWLRRARGDLSCFSYALGTWWALGADSFQQVRVESLRRPCWSRLTIWRQLVMALEAAQRLLSSLARPLEMPSRLGSKRHRCLSYFHRF